MREIGWQSWTRFSPLFPLSYQWESNPLPIGGRPQENEILQLKEEFGPPKKPIILWNSWTALGRQFNREILLTEAKEIKKSGLPIEYFVIDDGWCNLGDYQQPDKTKFGNDSHSLQSFNEHLEEIGLKSGYWIAPFLAAPDSNIVQEHPEWFLKDKRGKFINGMKNNPLLSVFSPLTCQLDTQQSAAIEKVYSDIDSIISNGARLIKLDFLHVPWFEPGLKNDSTPYQTLVDLFKYIRKKYPAVYTIACGCPFEPARYLVDAIRVGPDSTWPPDSSPQSLREFVYRVRRSDNNLKLENFPVEYRKTYGLDPDVIMYPSEFPAAYSDWLEGKFDVLGVGYSFTKSTFS